VRPTRSSGRRCRFAAGGPDRSSCCAVSLLVASLSKLRHGILLPRCVICVPKHGLYPGFQTGSNGRPKAERQFLRFPRGSLLAVTPPVHGLNVLRMVVAARSSHPSRIHVVGHDVAIIGERDLANGALPVLLNYFSIDQFPHFRFGAKLAVSSRMVRVFDTVHSEPSGSPSFRNRLAAAASERSMNGTILIAAEFHGFPPGWVFREKVGRQIDFLSAYIPIACLPPERFSDCPSQLADVRALVNVSR
jgi:hypothetical protein